MTTDTSTITASMTMEEILGIHPGARRALFRRYHLGGCSSCGFQPDETLDALCARNNNIPIDEVIETLHTSLEEDRKLQVSPAEVRDAFDAPEPKVRLLDIRTREEWDAVHVPEAFHFTQELMTEILTGWPREEGLIAIIDHDGSRSLDAAAYFAGHGFSNVRAVHGGIDAWSVQVDPSLPRYHLE